MKIKIMIKLFWYSKHPYLFHKQNILWLIKNNPKVRIKVIESDSFEMINLVEKIKLILQ